jgi:NADH-quinone oxidoreductase subunit J
MSSPILYVFAVMAVTGGLLAVGLSNVLYAIFALGLTLLGLAGLYLALEAPFVAAMQILIYIGGISVAMAFAVMLSASLGVKHVPLPRLKVVGAAAGALLFFVATLLIVGSTEFATSGRAAGPPETSVVELGRRLLGEYGLAFEVLSIVLLAAIIGAVVIAKKEETRA